MNMYEEDQREEEDQPKETYHTWDDMHERGMDMRDFV